MRILSVCLVTLLAVGPLAAGQFSQWRGPHRNGVAPAGPTLADQWPKTGPPKLWESEPVATGSAGGFGCPVVADGRVYVYSNWKYKVPFPHRTLSGNALKQLGGPRVKMPAELEKAVEKARTGDERAKTKGKDLAPWIKKWIADRLETEQQNKQYGRFIYDRLRRGRTALSLEILEKLGTIIDKRFADQDALDKWFADAGIDDATAHKIMRVIPTAENKAWDTVLCFDAADGKTLWQAKLDGRSHGWPASGTPTVADGRVYFSGSDGFVYCLDAKDGEEVWKVKLAQRGGLIHCSPLVADGKVVVLADQLTALNAKDGATHWQQPKLKGRDNSPVLWKHDEQSYVICNSRSAVGCVELATGKLLWTVPGGGQSTTAVAADFMAVVSSNKKVGTAAYRLSPDKPEKLWEKLEYVDGATSPLVHGGRVYSFPAKAAVCIDLATGQVAWTRKTAGAGYASPVVADGKLFVVIGKTLNVIAATAAEFKQLADLKLPVSEYASPAIVGGRLYVRLRKSVACYDLRPAPATE
jgi:outer membrane protein assembly factor BamB